MDDTDFSRTRVNSLLIESKMWQIHSLFLASISDHTLTTPETQGTITGAFGWDLLYDSEYLSLKLSLGFSACIHLTRESHQVDESNENYI